jgi:hypothetical protein
MEIVVCEKKRREYPMPEIRLRHSSQHRQSHGTDKVVILRFMTACLSTLRFVPAHPHNQHNQIAAKIPKLPLAQEELFTATKASILLPSRVSRDGVKRSFAVKCVLKRSLGTSVSGGV